MPEPPTIPFFLCLAHSCFLLSSWVSHLPGSLAPGAPPDLAITRLCGTCSASYVWWLPPVFLWLQERQRQGGLWSFHRIVECRDAAWQSYLLGSPSAWRACQCAVIGNLSLSPLSHGCYCHENRLLQAGPWHYSCQVAGQAHPATRVDLGVGSQAGTNDCGSSLKGGWWPQWPPQGQLLEPGEDRGGWPCRRVMGLKGSSCQQAGKEVSLGTQDSLMQEEEETGESTPLTCYSEACGAPCSRDCWGSRRWRFPGVLNSFQ